MFIIDFSNAKRGLLAIGEDELRTMDPAIMEKLHGNPFQNLFMSMLNKVTTHRLTVQGSLTGPPLLLT